MRGFGWGRWPALLMGCAWLLAWESVTQAGPLDVGRTAMRDEMFDVAEQQLRKAVQRHEPGSPEYADSLLLLLECLYRKDSYQAVLHEVKQREPWLAKQPSVAGYRYWQAQALMSTGDPAGGLAALAALPTQGTDPYLPDAKRLECRLLLAGGRTNDALRVFAEYESRFPEGRERAENLLDWGHTAYMTGQFGLATNVLQRIQSSPAAPDTAARGTILHARALARLGDFESASRMLRALGASDAVSADLRGEAWLAAAEMQGTAGDTAAAIESCREALALEGSGELRRRAAFALGYRLLRGETPEDGIEHLRALIRDNPQDPASALAQLTIADFLLESERADEALPAYQLFLEAFEDPALVPRAQWGRGWALFRLQRYDEAATAFQRAHDLFNDPVERLRALLKAADAEHAAGHWATAAQTYQQVVAMAREEDAEFAARALYQRGESLLAAGEAGGAMEAFAKLVETYGTSMEAPRGLIRLGDLHRDLGKPDEAVKAYGQVLLCSSNPVDQAEALLGRGLVQYRAFRFREALTDFRQTLSLRTADGLEQQAAYLEAMALYWLRRDDESLASCRLFLERYPESIWRADVLFWIGKYHYNRGTFEEAEQAFLDLAETDPDGRLVDEALLWAGRAAFRRQAYSESVETLTRLVTTCPDSPWIPEARFTQADALSEQARFDEAILRLDEIIEHFPDHDLVGRAWGRKGDCHFMLAADEPERYEEAIRAYRMVATIPGAERDLVLQAESKIGRCMEKQGRVADALNQYYTAVIARYLTERDRGVWHSESSQTWFAKSAFDAAELLAAGEQWRQAVRILERVVQTGVPGSAEAQERIDTILAERPWLR